MTTKLSIIIPVYNIENYLEDCLKSVLNQTVKSYEVIIVDDGSTDSSATICDKYSKNSDNITVIHKTNGGLSSARNAGILASNGEYISFVDGDDFIESSYVETILNNLDELCDLLSFQYKKSDGKTEVILPEKKNEVYSFSAEKDTFDFLVADIYKKLNWSAWAHVFKRSVIEEHSLLFEDNKRIFAEDMYFLFCYCSLIKKAKFIREPLYNYRIRENSIMDFELKNLNVGRMNELSKSLLSFYQVAENSFYLKCFPMIHYLVIRNVLYRALILNKLPQPEFRNMVINDVDDTEFFLTQIKKLINDKILFFLYINDENAEYDYDYLNFIYDGSTVKSKFRTFKRIVKKRCKLWKKNLQSK